MSLYPAPAAGKRFRVVYHTHQTLQDGINVRAYELRSTDVLAPTWEDLAQSISADVAPLYKALLTNTAKYVGLKLQPDLDHSPPYAPFEALDGSGFGTAGAAPLPFQTCGMISLGSGFIGRANRGRVYVPFPDQADNTIANQYSTPTIGYMVRLGALSTRMSSVWPFPPSRRPESSTTASRSSTTRSPASRWT
jgi:hypothetical protein